MESIASLAHKDKKIFYPELESLRGIAALMVVFFHFPSWYLPFYEVTFVRNGYLMVDFFLFFLAL